VGLIATGVNGSHINHFLTGGVRKAAPYHTNQTKHDQDDSDCSVHVMNPRILYEHAADHAQECVAVTTDQAWGCYSGCGNPNRYSSGSFASSSLASLCTSVVLLKD
jgi:hypothetical protein